MDMCNKIILFQVGIHIWHSNLLINQARLLNKCTCPVTLKEHPLTTKILNFPNIKDSHLNTCKDNTQYLKLLKFLNNNKSSQQIALFIQTIKTQYHHKIIQV